MTRIDVVIESGSKRTFASAIDWPGWARAGRDEASALQALFAYSPRYGRVVARTRLDFAAPESMTALHVVEKVRGNATTDFGAPAAPARAENAHVNEANLERLRTLLTAGWRAFDAGVDAARGRALRKGPRGGGRSVEAIVRHVLEAEAVYLMALGWPFKTNACDDSAAELERTRRAVLDGLAASARGEIAPKGPRGRARWKPRFFARRLAWHTLDHLWEIEDRSA